jgi:uncharacterized protein (DUF849 family)
MKDLGVKAELEIYDSGHADFCNLLLNEELLVEPLQFSVVMGVRGGMAATPENLVHTVRKLPPGSLWQVVAIGKANLEMTAIAVSMGGNARTGLEDTLHLRKGELAPDNAALVKRLAEICRLMERPGATANQAEDILSLSRRTVSN